MRRYAVILLLMLFGNVHAAQGEAFVRLVFEQMVKEDQNATAITTQTRVFDGYVLNNENVLIFYRVAIDDDIRLADRVVVIAEKKNDGDSIIPLSPATAEMIAHEVAPYIVLSERGRKFSEVIQISDNIEVKIASNEQLALSIELIQDSIQVNFVGDDAKAFVKNCIQAEGDSRRWFIGDFARIMLDGMNLQSVAMHESRFQNSDSNVAKESTFPSGSIPLHVIQSDYSANEFAANNKYDPYKGKSIIVTGTIRSVNQDRKTKAPRILFNEAIKLMSVSCTLKDSVSVENAASLQPGQTITVEGIWRGPNDNVEATIYDAKIIE